MNNIGAKHGSCDFESALLLHLSEIFLSPSCSNTVVVVFQKSSERKGDEECRVIRRKQREEDFYGHTSDSSTNEPRITSWKSLSLSHFFFAFDGLLIFPMWKLRGVSLERELLYAYYSYVLAQSVVQCIVETGIGWEGNKKLEELLILKNKMITFVFLEWERNRLLVYNSSQLKSKTRTY